MPTTKSAPLTAPAILVVDSGVGGLTVYRELARARPDARFVYVADDARFPYGGIPDRELEAHLVSLMGGLLRAYRPSLVVIACNTASTLALPALRDRYAVPFVGTVPAIKPACAASVSKQVTVLGTDSTVSREYTKALIREYADACTVTLVGSGKLAAFAEAELSGTPVPDAEIAAEITPCFVETEGRRTDAIVLACTHYPLLADRFARLSPWPVRFIDPAPAIARRMVSLIGGAPDAAQVLPSRILFTSGRAPSPSLAERLQALGLEAIAG